MDCTRDLVAFSVGGFTLDGLWIGAVLTGLAAITTAWAAVIRAKKQGSVECEENLSTARKEAEDLSAELHKMRMTHPEASDG